MLIKTPRKLDRRELLYGSGSLFGLALVGAQPGCQTASGPQFATNPFTLGVASGDPDSTSVVLWTRLAPDPLNGGGMPAEPVEVRWRLANDEAMTDVVKEGNVTADPAWAHSVHATVEGLEPDRWYHYQFHAGSEESPVARTRTAPPPGADVDKLDFSFVSCQHYETGYYTALRHLADNAPDLAFHLGDYIYEGPGREGRIRMHTGQEIMTEDDYRNRYALYKSDADLQAAHHVCPWFVTWDDHEVDNNYAKDISEEEDVSPGALLERRARAYKVYYEHMPLRIESLPKGPDMQLYRPGRWGKLLDFSVLDTRQYRTDQPCGDTTYVPPCDGVFDPEATLLGAAQQEWLFERLASSEATWNLLAQQIMVGRVDRKPGDLVAWSKDQWSGYDANRKALLQHLADSGNQKTIVITGDIHSNWANNLHVDFDQPESDVVATEFVGTSITSGGNGAAKRDDTDAMLAENPFVKYFNAQRGYVRCQVTPEQWKADYQVLDYVEEPGSPVEVGASFVVEKDHPGLQKA